MRFANQFFIFVLVAFALTTSFAFGADLAKGKRLYLSNCIVCHNKDPKLKGGLGPELIDSPLELMKVKVTTGRYPEGYPNPKRKTKIMKSFPQLEKDVPDIHAYIQSLK